MDYKLYYTVNDTTLLDDIKGSYDSDEHLNSRNFVPASRLIKHSHGLLHAYMVRDSTSLPTYQMLKTCGDMSNILNPACELHDAPTFGHVGIAEYFQLPRECIGGQDSSVRQPTTYEGFDVSTYESSTTQALWVNRTP